MFTDELWKSIEGLYPKIVGHPFNEELLSGKLPQEKFSFYLEQDSLYLIDFGRALNLLSAKVGSTCASEMLGKFALGALSAEKSLHESFFRKYQITPQDEQAPACFSYTQFLLAHAALETAAVGMAALLPCFLIYREVGKSLYARAQKMENHPYREWIETYAGSSYDVIVQEALTLTNQLAASAGSVERKKMAKAFYRSSELEWYFWEGAYQLKKKLIP